MQYPLISEYIDAIRSAEDNFDKLSSLRPVLDSNGNPVMSVGNFAVVFKMKDVFNDRLFAVKCFIKEQEQRSENYRLISEELNYVSSPYLLNVRYLERELFVCCESCDEEEFPVLVMEWVEGQPLDAYLKQHIDDTYDLQMLAYRFCKMGAWLLSQPFAHGDLKPDNILVREDGALVLVDYDGMYVSTMEGREACELGSPDFRHPLRDKESFDEHIDDFSIATIALSLKSIALSPQLYHQYGAADRLLFSANDYHDIGQSPALKAITALSSDSELSILLGVFLLSLAKKSLSLVSFRLLLLKEPEKPAIDVLSTEITKEERDNAIKDEYGAEYTADGLKLILVPYYVKDYKIKDGTRVIGNKAFWRGSSLTSIEIPDSVKSIGDDAFWGCTNLTSIEIPDSVNSIGDDAFRLCTSLTLMEIPDSVTSIGDRAFGDCTSLTSIEIPDSITSIGDGAFGGCTSLTSIEIPDSVKSIGNIAFGDCTSLTSIEIPDSVTSIGNGAFLRCKSLTSIEIPDSVKSIGNIAFCCCTSLTSIEIPDSVKSIGDDAFRGCTSLTSIEIPDSVKKIGGGILNGCHRLRTIVLKTSMYYIQDSILYSKEKVMISCWSNNSNIIIPNGVKNIGDNAFSWCESLTSIEIPDSVKSIGDGSFDGCTSLSSIEIPDSVTSIGNEAFSWCKSLTSIEIPDSVKSIGNYAFRGCTSLTSIEIPDSVKSIGDYAFQGCKSLTSIEIPDSVKSIGNYAFDNCESLTSIEIPDSVKSIGDRAFWDCKYLTSIEIPDSVKSIGDEAFLGCKSLTSIAIPDSVTSIGDKAFLGCTSLKVINIPKGTREKMLGLLGYWSEDLLVESI